MWRWVRPTHRTPHWVRWTHRTPHWGARATGPQHSIRSGRITHVRKRRREILRGGRPHPLLGREPGELGRGPGGIRQGLDRVLPRLPGPRPAGDALADRPVPEVLRGADDARPLR